MRCIVATVVIVCLILRFLFAETVSLGYQMIKEAAPSRRPVENFIDPLSGSHYRRLQMCMDLFARMTMNRIVNSCHGARGLPFHAPGDAVLFAHR